MNLLATTAKLAHSVRPSQGIDDILHAGFSDFVIDGSMYLPPNIIMRWDKKLNDEWIRNDISTMKEVLRKRNIVPKAVSLPYASFEMLRDDYVDVLIKYSKLLVREFEQMGVRKFIVKPITVNITDDKLSAINEKFYLELAEECQYEETKLLLINVCKNVGGHLIRGMFTEPEDALEWINRLNGSAACTADKRFAFCADIGAYNICAMNLQDTLNAVDDILDTIIIRDNNGQEDVALMPFFGEREGIRTVDHLSLIRGLREIRFDKDIVIDASDSIALCPQMLVSKYLSFERDIAEYIKWQIELETSLFKYDRIVLFGAGNMCRNFMKSYGNMVRPLFACDNNPELWGTVFEGLEVRNPIELKKLPPNTGVYICNIYYREIKTQLQELGVNNIEFFNDEYLPSYHENRIDRNRKPISD